MSDKINVIFMGGFVYPRGMAGTRRIQNTIDALKEHAGVSTRVIVQRQFARDNVLTGVHEGTPYETVMGDLLGARLFPALPVLFWRTNAALKRAFRPDYRNVIYFYGPLFFDSVVPLRYARKIGYKIVIDVIEDYDFAKQMSLSLRHSVQNFFKNRFSKSIKQMAAGIIAISSHLEKKYTAQGRAYVPVLYMPISVDMDRFSHKPDRPNSKISLFYAGSFAKKDGLSVLLDAFDKLAAKYQEAHLVLTGRGDREAMQEFYARRDASPYKDRIEYKGFLDEKDYYALLNSADIPCMTRVDLAYAHAGFPFKLGEYLATGKPVIASRVSDVDRFLTHKQNAMLVQAGSSKEVCEAAEFLIERPEFAEAIGASGREVARSFFDYKQQGKELVAFLQKL